MKNIAIIGSGSWGVALATHLAKLGNNIKVWSFDEEEKNIINNEKGCKFLPDLNLPDNIYCSLDFKEVRGTEGIKEASYKIGGMELNVAVVSGLGNAKKLLQQIRTGERKYHMVEVMACPGGCINGGGQPIQSDSVRNYENLKELRSKALYDADKANKLRMSHESPVIKMLYDEFFDAPGKARAHNLLHTTYKERSRF